MPNLSLKTLSSFHDAESYRAAWNDLVLRAGADVYQTFEWCSIWWKYYGTKRQLHLILAFQGNDLIGIVPAFTESLWLGPLNLRVAKTFKLGKEVKGKRDPMELTFTALSRNLFNHPNLALPSGNLSSTVFGQSTALFSGGGNNASGNRRIEFQLKLAF